MIRTKKFRLDKRNGKLMGVCAGVSNLTGVDPTIVRVATVVATLLLPWTILVYGLMAWLAKPATDRYGLDDARSGRLSTADLRDMRDIDRRLAEIDTYVAASDSRLAREIESLR